MNIAISRQPTIPGPARVRRRIAEIRATGRDVVDLASGEPDFSTPPLAIAAAHAAALRGETRYTDPAGTAELRRALRDKLVRENHFDVEPSDIGARMRTIAADGNSLLLVISWGQ